MTRELRTRLPLPRVGEGSGEGARGSFYALAQTQRGTVYVEFLISFVPFFLLFLGTIQLALIYASHLVVQHAAVLATRAAVVTLDDDPCFHRGEARGVLPLKERKDGDGFVQRALGMIGLGDATGNKLEGAGGNGGSKLKSVRNAAYLPLAALAPSPEQLAAMLPWATDALPVLRKDPSVRSALGEQPALRIAAGFAAYNRVASAITFPVEPGSKDLRDLSTEEVGVDELVTVRVTYLFSCNVPVVRDIICESFLDMTGWTSAKKRIDAMRAEPSVDEARKLGEEIFERLPRRLRYAKQLAREMSRAEWKWLVPALASSRNKFVALRAEATLPNQGAPYQYASELGQCECEGMDAGGES